MATPLEKSAVYTTNGGGTKTLPSGSCNFRDLAADSIAYTCGCRTFWLNDAVNEKFPHESEAWCYCGHHACFHDFAPESEISRASVAAQSHKLKMSKAPVLSVSNMTCSPDVPDSIPRAAHLCSDAIDCINCTIRKNKSGTENGGGRALNDGGMLNPLANHNSPISHPGKFTGPSFALRNVPFHRQTLPGPARHVHLAQSHAPPVPTLTLPRYANFQPHVDDIVGSATELNTPSVLETPTNRSPTSATTPCRTDVEASRGSVKGMCQYSRGGVPNASRVRDSRLDCASLGMEYGTQPGFQCQNAPSNQHTMSKVYLTDGCSSTLLPDWRNLLTSCARRLDILESVSFSQVPMEEIQEKFELFEGRLLDLESWRQDTDAEGMGRCEEESSCDQSQLTAEDAQLALHDAGHDGPPPQSRSHDSIMDFESKIDDVEQRIGALEAAFPSYAYPWEIEVIVLPWGRNLQGIWKENPFPTSSKKSSQIFEEWNGVESQPERTLGAAEPHEERWAVDSIERPPESAGHLLYPKAPGPNSIVYKRLKSRGLVRVVTTTNSGSHELWRSIEHVFSSFCEAQAVLCSLQHEKRRENNYGAFSRPFLPLRKVHKSSQLQFLEPYELSPATWNIPFLDTGVFMKASGGLKRLYITTPEAYMQSEESSWTWQRLKELQSTEHMEDFDLSSSSHSKRNSRDVDVSYWSKHPRIDPQPRSESIQSSPPVSPASEKGLRQKRKGTSLSSCIEPCSMPPSCNSTGYSSPDANEIHKRRRLSTSPINNDTTPRWSHEPLSQLETDSVHNNGTSSKRRGLTPFAYATPHSDNMARIYMNVTEAGDTEPDSDESVIHSEKAWEGVAGHEDSDYDSDFSVLSSDLGIEVEPSEYDDIDGMYT